MSASASALDEIINRVKHLDPKAKAALTKDVVSSTQHKKWVPNPGPQTDAYFSLADVLLFGGEPGGGKLLSLDTPIPTPFGWTTMGEIRVGDLVLDENGTPCSVVGKSDIETEATYHITFSDGSLVVSGARHQWLTSTRAERMRELKCNDAWRAKRRASRAKRGTGKKPWLAELNTERAKALRPAELPTRGIRTTQEIYATLLLPSGRLNHCIPVCGALQLPEIKLLVEPYVLGVWLGDGTTNCGTITGIDEEIFAEVANYYTVTRRASCKARGTLGLQADLRTIGVLGNKHIPPSYLRASIEQRLALLQGLMDTDGYCDTRGQCEISLTRKALIDGVSELLSSLGIKAQMREGLAKLNGRVTGPKWRLKFQTDLPAFRLPRKLLRQKRAGFRGTHDVRYIERCDPVDPVDMQCIQVDSPSHMYLCGKAMIPTHNSQLVLGLAFNEHQRSLIMRRQYGDLDRLVEDALKIHGSRDGFNGSPPPKLKINDSKVLDFAAAHRVGDEQGQMGKGRDLLGIDEATHFAETQIRFLMGWNRTEDPKQRCRVVLATNPPLTAEGLWVIKMFAPWLDPKFDNPAKPGELRWVVSDDEGNDKWVDGPGEYEVIVAGKPKMVKAKSRTYIPSSVKDNPYYVESGYESQLDAMPEPYRSLLMGGFRTQFQDQANQIIPTAWVIEAQKRWKPTPPRGVPMCALGVDCSGGGTDPMTIAPRYDGWFDTIKEIKAKDIPMERAGSFCAGQVLSFRRGDADIIIDLGGGYGSSTYEHLKANGFEVEGYKGAEATIRRSRDKKLKFTNTRSAALWAFREALDPGQPGGSPIALPQDSPQLLADLTAPTFEATPNGIKAEPKDKVCERLGRSTNDGDAVVMCWWKGPKQITHALEWAEQAQRSRGMPQVIQSKRFARRHK